MAYTDEEMRHLFQTLADEIHKGTDSALLRLKAKLAAQATPESEGNNESIRNIDPSFSDWLARLTAFIHDRTVGTTLAQDLRATFGMAATWGLPVLAASGTRGVSAESRSETVNAATADEGLELSLVFESSVVTLMVCSKEPGNVHFAVIDSAGATIASGVIDLVRVDDLYFAEKQWTGEEAKHFTGTLRAGCLLLGGR